MGIYNPTDGKKDAFTQTEAQVETKNNCKEKKNEFELKKVKEIEFEYINKITNSDIKPKDKSKEISNKYMAIIKEIDKLENEKNEKKSIEINKAHIKNIKSRYILKEVFNKLNEDKLLRIIKYNKKLQKFLNRDINAFKVYCEIGIELIPALNQYGKFINFIKREDKSYYHIYFDNNQKEMKRNFIIKNEKINKIKIKIDYQIKSFDDLFKECKCAESITFKKFNRNNIQSMKEMFKGCSLLRKIDLSNFNTENVKYMDHMFYGQRKLKRCIVCFMIVHH